MSKYVFNSLISHVFIIGFLYATVLISRVTSNTQHDAYTPTSNVWIFSLTSDLNSLNHRGQPKQSQINIYTGGSKTRNHARSGIAIIKHGNQRHAEGIKLNPNVTIFQSEAKAVCEAAQWLRLNRLDSENYVRIFTESQATIQALNNPHVTSKLIEDTITQLNLLGKTIKSLSIHWIEAHKGHTGNEKADEMARAAEFRTIMDELIDRVCQTKTLGSLLYTMDMATTDNMQNDKNTLPTTWQKQNEKIAKTW